MSTDGLVKTDEIEEQLKAAVRTLKALRAANARPAGFNGWPAVVREAYGTYKPDAIERNPQVSELPTPSAISCMNEAISWLVPLTERQRLLVFCRAGGIRWRALEPRFGKVERRLREEYYDALLHIFVRLQSQRKKHLG